MLACSETRLQRDVDSLPSLEHVPPPAVASAAAATAPAVKPPPPSKQAKQALDEVWRTIIPCLEAADLLSATCHYHHPELCKVEEDEVFCNATRKLIDEGKATVRDDGGLELESWG
ncbi:lactate dehydrogenase [Micractinium conductrix]|uniref:Lactate dehydrogenase n=1 Tax=Micractinium conductrix TaxID=554055 RepID=A0A2P6V817_9CHLO|nr:lactate dehydrogenase [Micractinium conductrix]|eukprot:PSC70231.1 lactate dehydrogenase [Micractinium conductrix]